MGSSDELKEIDIKNQICYYFDEITNINDLDLDKKSLLEEEIIQKLFDL